MPTASISVSHPGLGKPIVGYYLVTYALPRLRIDKTSEYRGKKIVSTFNVVVCMLLGLEQNLKSDNCRGHPSTNRRRLNFWGHPAIDVFPREYSGLIWKLFFIYFVMTPALACNRSRFYRAYSAVLISSKAYRTWQSVLSI